MILDYLKKNFKKITYNNTKFQNLFSSMCGPYTMIVIVLLSLGLNYTSILKLFSQYNSPDQFINYFYSLFFKINV